MGADIKGRADAPASPPRAMSDLGPRIASGLVLAAIALALNYAGLGWLALLVLAVGLIMSWEWGRVVGRGELDAALIVHALAVIAAVLLSVLGLPALGALVILAAMAVVALVELGRRPVISALGVAYVGLPAVALLWLRGDEPLGAAAVLLLLLIVWTSDTAAFAAGRTFRGPKLWPRVSPNKTWSGLAGALLASALAGALFALISGLGTPACLAGKGVLLGLVAQLGDLAESSLKRGFGVKDASALIPGHGGFMDRADSMVAATMAAALLAAAVSPGAPARALLGC